jgi:hypothetical protein
MRAFVIGVAALAFSATLSACSSEKSAALAPVKTDPAAVEKLVAELTTKPFKGKATAAADVAAVRDALPKEVALTWGGLNFDQASGATVLTAVKLTPAEMPTVGLSIDEVRLWDFDADFAKARLTGQRLAETATLARRLELKGAKVFGIETLMAPAVDAATQAVEGAVSEDPLGEDFNTADFTPKLENYEIGIGHMVIDDFVLRPYEMTPAKLEPGSEFAEMMPVLQQIAAVSRSFASNASAAQDLKISFAMTQLGQKMAFDMSAKTVGARLARRRPRCILRPGTELRHGYSRRPVLRNASAEDGGRLRVLHAPGLPSRQALQLSRQGAVAASHGRQSPEPWPLCLLQFVDESQRRADLFVRRGDSGCA